MCGRHGCGETDWRVDINKSRRKVIHREASFRFRAIVLPGGIMLEEGKGIMREVRGMVMTQGNGNIQELKIINGNGAK